MRAWPNGRPGGFGHVPSAERLEADRFLADLLGVVRPPETRMRLRPLPTPPVEHDTANTVVLRPGSVGPAVDGTQNQAHIAVVSPSSSVAFNTARFVARFRHARHDVAFDLAAGEPAAAFVDGGHDFAGNDVQRWNTLRIGLFDRGTTAVVASSGGHGATRLLDEILDHVTTAQAGRWPRVPPPPQQFPPKRIVGFSDFTAVLLAAYNLLGWAGLHGPMLCCPATGIPPAPPDFTSLDRLVRAMTVAPGALDPGNLLAGNLSVVGRIPNNSVRGVMLGGNLSLVDALYGSPFFPSLQGGILFVEETNEPGRKIDRMIEGLKQRGAARQALAVVVGQITGAGTIPAADVAALFNRSWNKPVAHMLDAGHDRRSNRTFWMGLEYELQAQAGGTANLLLRP